MVGSAFFRTLEEVKINEAVTVRISLARTAQSHH